jgi:prepilin-type N-terminal cleavage/methylation domain-containing protein
VNSKQQKQFGFTLIELLLSMALGVLVLGSAVSMFVNAMNLNMSVTQRAEMQQNDRASMDLLAHDISLAGAGLPTGGVQLPNGANSVTSRLGCDQTAVCYITNPAYPNNPPTTNNNMYGIIPSWRGSKNPITDGTNTSTSNPDAISVVYADTTFGLQYYTPTLAGLGTANPTVTFVFVAPNPPPNPLPATWPPAAINDPIVGLKVGDLVLLSNSTGSAVGEVTNVVGNVVTFANGDPLRINQSGAAAGNFAASLQSTNPGPPVVQVVAPLTAKRLWMTTYYVDQPAGNQTARLMRQVNGQTPNPVAEDISGLAFTYDFFNETTNQVTYNQTTAANPSLIRKVNITVTTRAALKEKGTYQSMSLSTSVSARNMSFKDRYN